MAQKNAVREKMGKLQHVKKLLTNNIMLKYNIIQKKGGFLWRKLMYKFY